MAEDRVKKKILMVDDEVGFVNMMKLYLEKIGAYEVKVESNPFKAIDVAKEFKPDMIFLDVVMPGIDGGELVKRFGYEDSLKNVPIVFLTAIVNPGETADANGIIGGHDFLAKPVSGEQIIKSVEEHLG